MAKRRRQPAHRKPPLRVHSSGRLHVLVEEVSKELTEVLSRVSLDHWEPEEKEACEAELRQAISCATDSPERQQVLFEKNVLGTVYTRANVALDYMKALPLLLVADSLLAVRPMARATLEAFARLDWHCEPDISPEERILRAFTDFRQTFEKISGRRQGLQTPDGDTDELRDARSLMSQQPPLLKSMVDEEIRRMAEIVSQRHGTKRCNESKKFVGPTKAVDDALERALNGPAAVSWYQIFSDSAHADAIALALRLIHRHGSRRTYQYSHTPKVADHLMPLAPVILLMFNTLLRMSVYWRIDAPYDDINSICGLLNRHVIEHGDAAVWES